MEDSLLRKTGASAQALACALAFLLGVALILLTAPFSRVRAEEPRANDTRAVWLWSGLAPERAAAANVVYVFQGELRAGSANDQALFRRLGIRPSSRGALAHKSVVLVVRLLSLDVDSARLAATLTRLSDEWATQAGASVLGVQLDFDAPTSKLLPYSRFLADVRRALPKKLRLSVTGLADWLFARDASDTKRLLASVDEVVFQLYQGTRNYPDFDRYLRRLGGFDGMRAPRFKLGLVDEDPLNEAILARAKDLRGFDGTVYFLR